MRQEKLLVAVYSGLLCCSAIAQESYQAMMNGSYVVPPSSSTGTAVGTVTVVSNRTAISVDLSWQNLYSLYSCNIAGPASPGANAATIFSVPMTGLPSGSVTGQVFSITPTQLGYLTNGQLYMQAGLQVRGQLYPAPVFWTLTITTNGNGSVTPSGGSYLNGSIASLTAVPAPHYTFVGWSGDASGTANPLDLTMTNSKSVTASFQFFTNYVPTLAELAIRVSWFAGANTNYQIQAASMLDSNNWQNLGGIVPGNGSTNYYYDVIRSPSRFYRVITQP